MQITGDLWEQLLPEPQYSMLYTDSVLYGIESSHERLADFSNDGTMDIADWFDIHERFFIC